MNPDGHFCSLVTVKSLIREEMADGRILAPKGPLEAGRLKRMGGRIAIAGCLVLALLLIGFGIGRASDRDETTLTVQVSSADHEQEEGYFSLGDSATVLAKPGSELHRFLTRQRGHKVKIVLQDATRPDLSRLER